MFLAPVWQPKQFWTVASHLVMESRNMHKYNSSIHGTVAVRLPPVIFLWLDHTTFSSSLPGSENESMLDRFRPVSMCCTFPTNQSHFECRWLQWNRHNISPFSEGSCRRRRWRQKNHHSLSPSCQNPARTISSTTKRFSPCLIISCFPLIRTNMKFLVSVWIERSRTYKERQLQEER